MTPPQKMKLQRHALESVTTRYPATLTAEEGEEDLKGLLPALRVKDDCHTFHAHQVEMKKEEGTVDIFITQDVRVN